jgi:plasmid stabilization system protein ParE
MNRKVIILDVAKPDYRDIKNSVKNQFGETVWNEVNQEFKTTISSMGLTPEAGTVIEELNDLGEGNFRMRLVRQTRIVYQYDDKQVLIHMFVHTKRDFRTHLMKRMLNK